MAQRIFAGSASSGARRAGRALQRAREVHGRAGDRLSARSARRLWHRLGTAATGEWHNVTPADYRTRAERVFDSPQGCSLSAPTVGETAGTTAQLLRSFPPLSIVASTAP